MSSPGPEFEIDVRETAEQAVVRLSGELDIATTPEAEEVLRRLAAQKREVVLDLSGLDFMDSTGLRMTIELDALARRDGFHFVIVRGSDVIHRLFEMSGVEGHLTLVDELPVE